MKKIIWTNVILMIGLIAHSQTSKTEGTLTFNISGFKSNSGQVMVQLFRKTDKVPTAPFKVLKANIVNKTAVVKINNLSYGDYSSIVVHDENSNGVIDHSWGIPAEPLGYTNNWELSLFSGMPTFDKLKFTFSSASNSFNIVVN